MRRPWLLPLLLLTLAFGLSAGLEPWFQSWAGSRTDEGGLLNVALGDGRRLFARHIYAKADAYFHKGYYPSIFDYTEDIQANYLSSRTGIKAALEQEKQLDFHGKPRDWIDRFSRHFYPSKHEHLGDASCSHEGCTHDHHHDDHEHGPDCDHHHGEDNATEGLEREILPWMRFSASLDPNQVETYVVAAFWLRTELNKTDEAEQFLREGLRRNPRNHEILFELGRIYNEDRGDVSRARNVWELALSTWRQTEGLKEEPNIFIYAQLLGNLARLEEQQENWDLSVAYLRQLHAVSPNQAQIQAWIGEVEDKGRSKDQQ